MYLKRYSIKSHILWNRELLEMKKSIALIIHGHRSLSRTTSEAIRLLEENSGLTVKRMKTKGPKDAIQLAQKACVEYDVVLAVGGDGTCNEVINGIMLSKCDEVQFGVIPNGTGNDFVRNLPKFSAVDFCANLVNGKGKRIDVGQIHFVDSSRYFLNVADIGFGAKVVETMERQRKKGLGGKTSYSLAILRTFFTYKKPNIVVEGDGIEFSGKALMMVFSNGSTFGHGLQVFPGAELDSGILGLTMIGNVSLYEYVKNLKNLRKGRRIKHKEVHYHEFETLKIQAGDNVFVETDGEIAGKSSVMIEVIPKAIFLIAGEE
jgi:diacylglycerol kinase (ATP)